MVSQRLPRILTLGWVTVAVAILLLFLSAPADAASDSPTGGGQFVEQTGSAPLTAAPTRSPIPTSQTPTSATDNEPVVVVVIAAVSLLVIAGGVVVARRRLTDDE